MPSLDQWFREWFSITLIQNPRLVRQIIGQSPIDGPTEVDETWIADKTDGGTKRNLKNKESHTHTHGLQLSLSSIHSHRTYSPKMTSPQGMRHTVFYAISIRMNVDNWNRLTCNCSFQFRIKLSWCGCEHWFRCYCFDIDHFWIVQAERMRLSGNRQMMSHSSWSLFTTESIAYRRMHYGYWFCVLSLRNVDALPDRNTLKWTQGERARECGCQ